MKCEQSPAGIHELLLLAHVLQPKGLSPKLFLLPMRTGLV